MNILYVASEALPYVSTGGLGDVIGSLPVAVRRTLGDRADVRVVLPLYPTIRERFGEEISLECETAVELSWRHQYCGIWRTMRDGVTFYFIDNEYYFKRPSLYGSFDDGERFAFFGKAVPALMNATGFIPDIVHANDWQSAPAVLYLKCGGLTIARKKPIGVLYTIHNIEYQGIYELSILEDVFGLSESTRSIVEYNGMLNLTKGAIVCADRVSTVSPRYAEEIRTEYFSCGLYHALNMYSDKLCGIINGIDTQHYNSESDPDIAAHFTIDDMRGKTEDKRDLQTICDFETDESIPLIVMVSRLASHKGFDLVRCILEEFVMRNRVQFAILGTGDRDLEEFFRSLSRRYPQKVCAYLEYNPPLAKKFYAGADLFLMPSRSEPCGLAQMIASRYGTIPVVREVGGLYDTIRGYNAYTGEGNGFSFSHYNAHDMMAVLEYALCLYQDQPAWGALRKHVMERDFSWDSSAQKYIALYTSMLQENRGME